MSDQDPLKPTVSVTPNANPKPSTTVSVGSGTPDPTTDLSGNKPPQGPTLTAPPAGEEPSDETTLGSKKAPPKPKKKDDDDEKPSMVTDNLFRWIMGELFGGALKGGELGGKKALGLVGKTLSKTKEMTKGLVIGTVGLFAGNTKFGRACREYGKEHFLKQVAYPFVKAGGGIKNAVKNTGNIIKDTWNGLKDDWKKFMSLGDKSKQKPKPNPNQTPKPNPNQTPKPTPQPQSQVVSRAEKVTKESEKQRKQQASGKVYTPVSETEAQEKNKSDKRKDKALRTQAKQSQQTTPDTPKDSTTPSPQKLKLKN